MKFIHEMNDHIDHIPKEKSLDLNSYQPFYRKSKEDDFYVIES